MQIYLIKILKDRRKFSCISYFYQGSHEQNKNVNFCSKRSIYFFRPLHIAASRHLVDTCELLLINGASVSIKDAQGLDPVLATATSYDAQTCLTMLLVAVKQEAQTHEAQTSSNSRNSLIHALRRSISSLGKNCKQIDAFRLNYSRTPMSLLN